jgi:hypothetical protein
VSSAGAVHRLVVFADACGSGTWGLETKRRMRAAMYRAVGEAYASVGVEPDAVHQEDRGDGIIGALGPQMPPTLMVGRWIDALYESLREVNAGSEPRLRVRVGMNAGLVLDDGRGLVGRAVDLACRLCDSPAAKRVMERADGADLLVVVSDWLYANVVAEGGRYVEPDHYRRASVRFKETDESAWFHIPRWSAPPLDGVERSETGGGPIRGDGPPPLARDSLDARTGSDAALQDVYHADGDLQVFKHNEIHGGFTGISKRKGG